MKEEGDLFEFQKTEIYQQIIGFIKRIYNITDGFPREELYGLTNQVRRAGISVALNFAEGWGRYNKREKSQFYKMARASMLECLAAIDIAQSLNYVKEPIYYELLRESEGLSKKFNALIKTVEK